MLSHEHLYDYLPGYPPAVPRWNPSTPRCSLDRVDCLARPAPHGLDLLTSLDRVSRLPAPAPLPPSNAPDPESFAAVSALANARTARIAAATGLAGPPAPRRHAAACPPTPQRRSPAAPASPPSDSHTDP